MRQIDRPISLPTWANAHEAGVDGYLVRISFALARDTALHCVLQTGHCVADIRGVGIRIQAQG